MASISYYGWCGRTLVIALALLLGLNLVFYTSQDIAMRYSSIWKLIARLNKVDGSPTHLVHRHEFKRMLVTDPPPGHMGSAVEFDWSDRKVASLVEKSIAQHGFNEYAATLVSVRRVLPDLRDAHCAGNVRDVQLPRTSIVIVFFNEPWSVLVRTVHSVLDNTPGNLIDEILLVDDRSFLRKDPHHILATISSALPNEYIHLLDHSPLAAHLKTPLDEYFRQYATVRILRAPERLGLIRARLFGAKNTTGSVLTFLDAHVECTKGWLEPLLAEVAKNETTIAIPLIDRVDDNDMHLIGNVSSGLLGAFEWDLNFGWWYRSTFPHRTQPGQAPAEPFETPAMAGGIFSIARRFFARLGWYDEQFRVYGMENSELSIKSWMCGGKILTVPCAHVAHIRKRAHPFIDPFGRLNVTFRNSIRLAEVWMDEFRQIVYDVNGIPGYREDLFGSVEERKATRARAGCRTFRYYLQRAYPEIPSPIVPGAFRGEVHSAALGNTTCLTAGPQVPAMTACDHRNETQFWAHNFYRELNSYKRCIDVATSGVDLVLIQCHRLRGSQAWHYDVDSAHIRNIQHGKCLTVGSHSENNTLKLEPCVNDEQRQKWYVTLVKYAFWKPFQ